MAHKVATASSQCVDKPTMRWFPLVNLVLDSSGHLIIEAGGTLSLILGLVLLAAIAGSYPASALSDRFGRKTVLYAMAAIGVAGGLLLLAHLILSWLGRLPTLPL